ncbi:MAG: DUF6383 domain-containing protein [Parabacteroides sp.]|nr:DUF6383 domain-containing protein [Parabacteroides sp.]
MSKKFSTLLAGSALLMGVASVNAQTIGNFWDSSLPLLEGDGSALTKFDATAKKGSYQLATASGDSVLYLRTPLAGETGVTDTLKFVPVPASSDSLANTLWCVDATENVMSDGSTNYVWEFFNVGAQKHLDFPLPDLSDDGYFRNQPTNARITLTASDSTAIGGDMGSWAFNRNLNVLKDMPLYTYFTKDSVVALANKEGGLGVYFVKDDANGIVNNPYATQIHLQKAGEIILSAKELNERLGVQKATDGVNLTFKSKFTQNALKDGTFFAEQIRLSDLRGAGLTATNDSLQYVYLYKMNGTDTTAFLKVDTSYTNSNKTHLAFKWDDKVIKDRFNKTTTTIHDSLKFSELKGQYMFLFTYRPSVDSINVYVKQATWLKNPTTSPNFSAADTTRKANVRAYAADVVVGSDCVLSVDSNNVLARPQNTWITFGGAMSCSASDNNRVTKENGLYVIYNKDKKKVLAGRIDENGTKYRWVELSQQDPKHMPAYQWLVLKNRENSAESTLTLINREFEDGKATNVQLYKDGTASRFSIGSSSTFGADDVFDFEQITDSAIIKNEHLGYGYYSKDDVTVAQYKFNYLNTLNMDRWLNTREKDSILWAAEDAGAFNFKFGKETKYGVEVDKPILDKISGLAQLKRATYVIYMDQDTLLANADNRYAVGEIAQADSFYFKENNCIEGVHYYAIIKSYNEAILNNAKKGGISDIGDELTLKVEDLSEVRTSAFAIKEYDTPLYRSFNKAVLGENEDNSADSLLFREAFRQNEYLMDEHNKTFMHKDVDYAGIWTADKGENMIGFRIDTARMNCSVASKIKPQYLLSVSNVVVGAKACTEASGHRDINNNPTDEWGCVHATRGFVYGKYLVSYQDSVDANGGKGAKKALPFLDNINGYTRIGFEPAIVSGDSLIFLVGEFETMPVEKPNVNTILKTYADKKITNDYVKKLGKDMTDAHHNYTWLFRYINPIEAEGVTKESKENAFLIESDGNKDIAPTTGVWMKQQNGCLVLTEPSSTFDKAVTGTDGALIFNAYQKSDKEDMATDNEAIATSEVTVIAQNGAVRIANAEGKKVVITNILGQVVANTVITSSDATIAAPAGVVVVAVEGEEAVKAIVK